MSKDYYQILGVTKSANEADIKSAFRRLAHQHHPDKGGDQVKFKEINEAYQVLSDTKKRAQYDQFGQVFDRGGPAPREGRGGWDGPSGNGPFGAGGFSAQDFGDIFSGMGFGDIFSATGRPASGWGGQGRARTRTARGQDIEMTLTLEFREAVFGTEKKVELYKTVTCEHCKGNGAEPGSAIKTCETCGGQGQTVHVQRTILGNFQTATVCRVCQGEGKKAEKSCRNCGAQGIVKKQEAVTMTIPAGIDNGETLRVSHQGEAGRHGGGAGDLYITVRVKPDSRFARDGQTISTTLVVSISEAVLGIKKIVETLDGPVELNIPPGTQSGTKLRLKGRGVPALQKSSRGDHLVLVLVKIPEKLNRQARKLYEELQFLDQN